MWIDRWTKLAAVVALTLVVSSVAAAQAGTKTGKKGPKDSTKAKAPKDSGQLAKFYQTETPLAATLTTNIKRIRGDKSADAPWRAATLSYPATAPDTGTVTVPVRIRTRGIWRLKTCEFPPIRLNFTSEAAKGTVFRGL